MSYRKALEALKAYPDKELRTHYYQGTDGCRCVFGVIAPSTIASAFGRAQGIRSLMFGDSVVQNEIENDLGMTEREAVRLQQINDDSRPDPELAGSVREARYLHVLDWLETQVKAEDQLTMTRKPC